jgi:uncharacterized membrane protein YraQ (UPF0718 family)
LYFDDHRLRLFSRYPGCDKTIVAPPEKLRNELPGLIADPIHKTDNGGVQLESLLTQIALAAKTSLGFFWKAGWAFVLGYAVSAIIQAFVPRGRLTKYLGGADLRSVGLATSFGAISSSCSFAALAAARALFQKGAHFVAAVAFMFASTNLVIELGVLILIFLGWQFLLAEIIGGILLIVISSALIRLTYPKAWINAAREKLAEEEGVEEDFDWRERLRSRAGWRRVGRAFGMEWGMVWREILVGFTIAGIMAVFVPHSFWKALFLADSVQDGTLNLGVATLNALIAPFVAAATFIGSMGNIPLATVLNSGGVLFAGILGFIYSDLMVPPLVRVNAKYYGWRVALYVAAVMFASIVLTALILHVGFFYAGITPESRRRIDDVTQFGIDYTFWLNLVAVAVVTVMIWLARSGRGTLAGPDAGHDHDKPSVFSVQNIVTWVCVAFLSLGLILFVVTGGT